MNQSNGMVLGLPAGSMTCATRRTRSQATTRTGTSSPLNGLKAYSNGFFRRSTYTKLSTFWVDKPLIRK